MGRNKSQDILDSKYFSSESAVFSMIEICILKDNSSFLYYVLRVLRNECSALPISPSAKTFSLSRLSEKLFLKCSKIPSFYSLDTSRQSRPGEIHGKDYFFDSREQMETDIAAGKFIEHGEYRGNLYGTSVDGIRDFVQAGYQPIISPHYQVPN